MMHLRSSDVCVEMSKTFSLNTTALTIVNNLGYGTKSTDLVNSNFLKQKILGLADVTPKVCSTGIVPFTNNRLLAVLIGHATGLVHPVGG